VSSEIGSSKSLVRELEGHRAGRKVKSDGREIELGRGIQLLVFTPGGERLLSAGSDHRIRVWDVATGKCLHVLEAKSAQDAQGIAVSPDGKLAVSGHGGWGGVLVWDLEKGALVEQLIENEMFVSAVAFSKDGSKFFATKRGATLWIWETATRKNVQAPKDSDAGNSGLAAFVPGATAWVAAPQSKRQPVLYAVPGRKKLAELPKHEHVIRSIAVSPDGKRFASGGDSGELKVSSIPDGAPVRELKLESRRPASIDSMSFSPDGSRLALSHDDARVVDLASGKDLWSEDAGTSLQVAFSPDGKLLAVGNYEGVIFLVRAPA
jgi:WD40 repeat protein